MAIVQVIVPTYNSSGFIRETVESVLSQNVDELDVLIIDNCSGDDTQQVISPYLGRGVKYIRNEANLGAIGNHNRALELATGDYIKLLSSDDVLMPGVLRRQATALDEMPDVGVVTCNCLVTDAALSPYKREKYLPGFQSGSSAVSQCAHKVANLLGAPSNTLLRRIKIGTSRFDTGLKWMADLEFLCQILAHCDYFNIDEDGFFYRRHDLTDSILSCSNAVRLHDELYFTRKYGGGLAGQGRILLRLARERLRAGCSFALG